MKLFPITLGVLLLAGILCGDAAAQPLSPWGENNRQPGEVSPVKWGKSGGAEDKADTRGEFSRPLLAQVDPGDAGGDEPGRAHEPATTTPDPPKPACASDDDCAEDTYCHAESKQCVEVGRPINIIYLYYRSGDRKFREVLGIYWHQEGETGYRVVVPFYWDFWSPGARKQMIFPFVYQSATVTESFAWVFPLNFYWRDEDQKSLLMIPLAYASWGPKKTAAGAIVPPFYYSREGNDSTLVVLPLFFRGTGPDKEDSYSVLFPVFWQFTSKGRSTTLAGPFFHHRRGGKTTAGLVPLAIYRRDDDEDRSLLISPLFAYENDGRAQVKHWGLLAPPYYHRRDSERDIDAFIPFFLRWHNRKLRSTTYVVGPLVYYDDPDGGTQVFFPFFWRFSDTRTGAATSILFPIFYRHKRPDGSQFNLFFPFFLSKGEDRWSTGVIPLFFAGASKDRRHAVLFPIFWHFKNQDRSTTVVGPGYYAASKTGWKAGFAPLLFLGSSDLGSHQVLFPIFWHLRDTKEETDTWVAGPGFYHKSKRGKMFGLIPLFAAGERDGTSFQAVLPPLFLRKANEAKGTSSMLIGPYYHWREPGQSGHVLAPLAYYSSGDKGTTAAVLPLVYYKRSQFGKLLITPVGGFHKDDKEGVFEGIFGPYAWHYGPETRGFALLPLFFRWEKPQEQSTTTILFPLFVRHVSPTVSNHVLFPLFWRFKDDKESSLVVFPFYWRMREKAGFRADVVFPLYWDIRGKERWARVIGPVFAHENKKEDLYQAGVFPLAYYHRNKEGSYLGCLPFIFYRNNFKEKKRTWVVGPAWHIKSEEERSGGFAPLVWYKRSPEDDYTVVLPLAWHFGNPKEKRSTTFVGPWFYRRQGEEKSTGLVPLFYTAWDNAGGRSIGIFPLFYLRTEPDRLGIYTPIFGYDKSPQRKQWYAGPYFQRDGKKISANAFFPLFIRYRNHELGQTTMGVVPFYLGRWSRENSFHLVFPLFWRWKSVDDSSTVVFPVVWDFHDHHLARTTVVFPLFLRHANYRTKETSYVVPPVWVRTRPESSDTVVFPLVWHFGGVKKSTTIGFPFYWDFKRGSKRTTVVFPLYWNFDRPGHETWVVANTYYRKGKHDDSYNFLFFPLVQVQRKRPGDIKVEILGGVVGYERIGINRHLTIFFIPLKLQPTSGKTLSGMGGTSRYTW